MTTNQTIVLHVQSGVYGGAPPKRVYHPTESKQITIEETATVEELSSAVQNTGFKVASGPLNMQLDPSKNLRENGLSNGSTLQYSNGMMD